MIDSRLLVIDDDFEVRKSLRMILEYDGYEVSEAATGEEGVKLIEREAPDLVFLDIKMPGMDGLEVLGRVRATNDTLPVVIVSAHGSAASALEAGRLGAFRFIEKPLSKDYVLDAVREGLELGRLRSENRQLRTALDARHQLVGDSAALKGIMDKVRRAAPTSATVLILGESGVGKELVARAVHRHSQRGRESFVQVNCAAIPEELIESELFGHERGAFTDARSQRKGLLEQAEGGTVFLDEIGEMPAALQAKLLRFLEEKTFKRVGGSVDIHVDVRVIAATNRKLDEEVRAGRFREDLYYRLNVLPIMLPPLRDRTDDVPLLVEFYIDSYNTEFKKRVRGVAPDAMKRLQGYGWPGNIRELRNAVERAMLLVEHDYLKPEDFTTLTRPVGAPSRFQLPPEGVNLEDVERQLLVQALDRASGNQTQAGQMLGINRDQVRYRIEKFGLQIPQK